MKKNKGNKKSSILLDDKKRDTLKLLIVGTLLILCFWGTYYFHYVLKNDVLYTHFFYVPIVLACMWWDWRGLIVAVVLAAAIITTHLTSQIGVPVTNDLTRAAVFLAIGSIVTFLTVRRRQAESALKDSETRYRRLFEDSPIPLWEDDWSKVNHYLKNLRSQGVNDFRKYFNDYPGEVTRCTNMIKVLDVNKASLELYEAGSKEELLGNLDKVLGKESYNSFKEEIIAVAEGKAVYEGEAIIHTLTGSKRYLALRWSAAPGYEKTLSKVIVSTTDITIRKETEKIIRRLAYRDVLTGLPNRTLLHDRLDVALIQAQRKKQKLALMLLDLDKFKDVNDNLGHNMGDKLLKSVGSRLTNLLRKGDTVARMGGDEFTILLTEIDEVEDTTKIAQKIMKAFQEPFMIDDHELHVTTSIGITIYPSDGEDADTLMKEADIAMYAVKKAGRNNYQRYTPEMSSQTDR